MNLEVADRVAPQAIDIKPLDLGGAEVRPATSYPLWKRVAAVAWVIGICGIFGFFGLVVAILATGSIGCN